MRGVLWNTKICDREVWLVYENQAQISRLFALNCQKHNVHTSGNVVISIEPVLVLSPSSNYFMHILVHCEINSTHSKYSRK